MAVRSGLLLCLTLCFVGSVLAQEPKSPKQEEEDLPEFHFNCETGQPLPDRPTSVHQLRPADIHVVSAIGDSITAGYGVGAANLSEVSNQNRGESWSVGGLNTLDDVVTVGNLLKQFNPDLKGWSWCYPHGGVNAECANKNAAVGGATNLNMPGQASNLINKMGNDPDIDFENDWKLMTLLVGGNDMCAVCRRPDLYNPDVYRDNIQEALDDFHANMPRTLVNLVVMFDISPLKNMSSGDECDAIHQSICMCAINETTREYIREVQLGYYYNLKELVDSGRYDTTDDFTVVLQPHMTDLTPQLDENGNWDNTWLSHDCFHPNRKGHQLSAYMLWNTMLIPVPDKPLEWIDEDKDDLQFYCPTEENPYIFTNLNSGVKKKDKQADKGGQEAKTPKQEELPVFHFNCETGQLYPDRPTSVHQLRPSDIHVVSAIGDSVTAGYSIGASNISEVYDQNRGESWSVGGLNTLDDVVTVANVLKQFNPDLKGWSWCYPHGGVNEECANKNAAVGGASNLNMPGQASNLINKMRNDPDIDFENDWKLMTLLIGYNDLCAICRRPDLYNPDVYRDNIQEALDDFHANMPRTLVNLVVMFDVSWLTNMSSGEECDALQLISCMCAVNDTTRKYIREVQLGYYYNLKELVDSGRYDTTDDFTVVLQPHMTDLTPLDEDGNWDNTWLSHDCFHPNRKGQQLMAYMLWNTMLIPVPDKPLEWIDEDKDDLQFYCPTEENPYIFTNLNSGMKKKDKQVVKGPEAKEPKEEEEENPYFSTNLNTPAKKHKSDISLRKNIAPVAKKVHNKEYIKHANKPRTYQKVVPAPYVRHPAVHSIHTIDTEEQNEGHQLSTGVWAGVLCATLIIGVILGIVLPLIWQALKKKKDQAPLLEITETHFENPVYEEHY